MNISDLLLLVKLNVAKTVRSHQAQLFSPNIFSANKFYPNTWRLITHKLLV